MRIKVVSIMLTVNVYNSDNKVYSLLHRALDNFQGAQRSMGIQSKQGPGNRVGNCSFLSSIGLPLPSILGMVSEFAKD